MNNFKIWIAGIGLSFFCIVAASNSVHIYKVKEFYGLEPLSGDLLKPKGRVEWPLLTDPFPALEPRVDSLGHLNCSFVLPIEPSYHATSTFADDTKLCCITQNKPRKIPTIVASDHTDYFCGTYPDYQIVRVSR